MKYLVSLAACICGGVGIGLVIRGDLIGLPVLAIAAGLPVLGMAAELHRSTETKAKRNLFQQTERDL